MLTASESFLLIWLLFTGVISGVTVLESPFDTEDANALLIGVVTLAMVISGYILTII